LPFITEGIFQNLNELCPDRRLAGIAEAGKAKALTIAQWPQRIDSMVNDEVEKEIAIVQWVVKAIRDIRTKYNRPLHEMLVVSARIGQEQVDIMTRNADLIKNLAGVKEFKAGITVVKPPNAAVAVADATEVFVHDAVDVAAERQRLEKQRQQLLAGLKGVEAKLGNESFISKAKPEVVAQTKAKLAELQGQLAAVEKHLAEL
jgi:valyl-tRNA synthetase